MLLKVRHVNSGINRVMVSFKDVQTTTISILIWFSENLEVHPEPHYIEHPEIGRYFTEFKVNHFVPNNEKAKEYPNDEALRISLLEEAYGIPVS